MDGKPELADPGGVPALRLQWGEYQRARHCQLRRARLRRERHDGEQLTLTSSAWARATSSTGSAEQTHLAAGLRECDLWSGRGCRRLHSYWRRAVLFLCGNTQKPSRWRSGSLFLGYESACPPQPSIGRHPAVALSLNWSDQRRECMPRPDTGKLRPGLGGPQPTRRRYAHTLS